MKYIPTDFPVPFWNMALEEMLMTDPDFSDDYVFFYIHNPSVIVGKHQNTLSEVNYPYIKENGIHVARRLTGGGAVYHDRGNLNFSFVFRREGTDTIDFEPYTKPVIDALKELGVSAQLSGRNDILIDGKKFSGNAQYRNRDKVLSHGTLMFDLDVEAMVNSLNVSQLKIESKAIESVRSRVANLKSYIKDEDMDILSFRSFLLQHFFEGMEIQMQELTAEQKVSLDKRVEETFSTWNYNYGSSPAFALTKKKKYPFGLIEAGINVKDGIIQNIRLSGDFFVNTPIENLTQRLAGAVFREDAIASVEGIEGIIAGMSLTELIDLLFY